MNKQLSVSFLLILSVSLSLKGKEGGGWERVCLATSSRTTILRFTSHETNIYVFTLLGNRGRTKYQKRYVGPIL